MKYHVAVRALCEFTAKRGDLDLRFTPSPSAQEGIAGHATLAARRGSGYQTEIALEAEFKRLHVRGRADGFDAAANQLEELKTHRGPLERMPDNHRQLHWAQLRVYGWLMCQKTGQQQIELRLVYLDIESQRETVLSEPRTAASLQEHFENLCEPFLSWADRELAHRAARDQGLTSLAFPHESFQAGQRQLAESVYKTVRNGGCLLAQAPTGIGKTLGTMFPALKAMPAAKLDKVFCVVAKTSGRAMALDALRLIRQRDPAPPLRVLELVAREKACEYPENACFGDSCPLAKGFYDRLAAARSEAVTCEWLDQGTVRTIALRHQVCPYYLSQELARWCDVVVGDYNYYFDSSALLFALTVVNEWQVSVLVDEAHNMVERGRAMYTASLDRANLRAARKAAPKSLKNELAKIGRCWTDVQDAQAETYQVHAEVPQKLLLSLQRAATAITSYLSEDPAGLAEELQRFYFDSTRFCRMAEQLDDNSLFDVTKTPEADDAARARAHSVLCLRNVIPGRFLARRFAQARSVVLFSATLNPHEFYRDVLGLPNDTGWLDVSAPFSADQLSVQIVRSISTRFRHREQSVAPIVDVVANQYAAQPGNYLAFFSSFDYLNQVLRQLQSHHPGIPVWAQQRQMAERQRESFLARFQPDGQGVGFAVLGGAFGEGIDLPGRRLIGAFIATLGLPQMNPINEEMQRRIAARFGTGYEYTYLYPGLRKVVQAAGRVIRTPADRGVIYLIDDRFARPEVRKLLPQWWQVREAAPPARAHTIDAPRPQLALV